LDAIGVIDIKDGIVVRGVAGERDKYREVKSRIVEQEIKTPLAVAGAYYKKLGIRKLYAADLDAIMNGNKDNNLDKIKEIKRKFPDMEIMLDAGFNKEFSPENYLNDFLDYAVIATESLEDIKFLNRLAGYKEQIIISIDLKEGELIHNIESWQKKDISEIIEEIKSFGFKNYILLDLASVGTARGISDYIRNLKKEFSNLNFITGGGVKDYRDIKDLKKLSFSGVLIASAFHNGSLGSKEVKLIEDDSVWLKIAWCITGAGHLLAESIAEIESIINNHPKVKVDIFLSQAGFEVLKIYNQYQDIQNLNCDIYKEGAASTPIIGRLYKGHYDLLVCAPATSNTIAKYVHGISDTLITNLMAHAGKSKVPLFVLPTDIEEELSSPAPDKMVDVYPREIDLKNTEKLKSFKDLKVIVNPNEVELWLKKYL